MSKAEFTDEIKRRTKSVSVQIFNECDKMPYSNTKSIPIKQIIRCSTSVAANYRAACRARSKAEFFAKMSIVVEESDETLFWLEFMVEVNIFTQLFAEPLMHEMHKLTALFATARKNT